MSFNTQTPTIVVLKEGTDTSQGKGQIITNINACLSIQETLKPTLGPFGSDILIVSNGKTTISNDGATILKLLDVIHPAAKMLVDISRAQDAEVGDGTTSVAILAGELLKESKTFVEDGMSTHVIIKGLRKASELAVKKVQEIAHEVKKENEEEFRDLLTKCAKTAMSSKLISNNSDFFSKMVVDAVMTLDQDELDEKLIGVKKVPGGAMEESLFVDGVAFKKTFSYAGFEQQPKKFTNPKILNLNVELELKAEKDNAEVRVLQVKDYQDIVNAEWKIIFSKLEAIKDTGANIVLSKLPIGDLATQYFADRGIFCAGRVASEDMDRVIKAVGGTVQSTCSNIDPSALGTCEIFEEIQIGSERYNLFKGCPEAKTCTLVLRGGAEQVIAEVERSLHDAVMIVKRTIRHNSIVAGGGATEMELSKHLRDYAKSVSGKQQLVIGAFARALEVIPRQLCENAGLDSIELLNKLRSAHAKGDRWCGVDFLKESVANNMNSFIWEPALVKINSLRSATEAACLLLSVDESILNDGNEQSQAAAAGRGRGAY